MLHRALIAWCAARQAWRDGIGLRHALTSTDGAFSCMAEDAVDLAYLLNVAEFTIDKCGVSVRLEVGEVLIEYLDGALDAAEAREQLVELQEAA